MHARKKVFRSNEMTREKKPNSTYVVDYLTSSYIQTTYAPERLTDAVDIERIQIKRAVSSVSWLPVYTRR